MSGTDSSGSPTANPPSGWRHFLALEREVVVIGLATFLLTLGDSLWFRYAPRYLEALGAGVIVIGLWGSLSDVLDAAWQYPGGLLTDRAGRKRALLVLTGLSLLGILVFLVPYWPVVLFGLAFYTAEKAYAQPATFAVIADALPKERRAMGFVVQSVLKRVPILVGAPLAGYLITAQLPLRHQSSLRWSAKSVRALARELQAMGHGTAFPFSGISKSWTRTLVERPFGDHSLPGFLKSPTSSFFFVSTEMTGCPRRCWLRTRRAMCWNCSSRSGWLVPSFVFRFA